jgi:thiazole-phosphate synthase
MEMLDWEKLLEEDVFEIAGRRFKSRLIIGSGKFKSFQKQGVLEQAGGDITVAVRRSILQTRTEKTCLMT